jgi:uncharacterized protein YndB with AHSA1/START domain
MEWARCPAESAEELSAEISINASPERVWDIVTDLERLPGIDASILSARWLDGATEARLGARFATDRVREGVGVWHAVSKIVEFVPGRLIEWTVESSIAPPAVCRFEIHPGDRATVVRQTYVFDTSGD